MIKRIFIALIAIVVIESCSKVPISGRNQVNLVPEDQIVSMALSQYRDFLSKHQVVTGTPEAQMVATVGQRIADAAATYLKSRNRAERIAGYRWEYNLIQDPQVNAWALPGGKIVVYTGILPYTQNEAGLATVVGHEVAHAIGRHGNERLSQGLLAQAGGLALDIYLQQHPHKAGDLFAQAYGLGVTVGALLPFSRLHESEADKMGLVLMAIAGYNPQEAVQFWTRMSQIQKQGAPPEFLSTHPSDAKRIADIKAFLPTAMRFYEKYHGTVIANP